MKNYFLIIKLLIIRISIPELKKVLSASSGEQTIGSPLMLNEVFKAKKKVVKKPPVNKIAKGGV